MEGLMLLFHRVHIPVTICQSACRRVYPARPQDSHSRAYQLGCNSVHLISQAWKHLNHPLLRCYHPLEKCLRSKDFRHIIIFYLYITVHDPQTVKSFYALAHLHNNLNDNVLLEHLIVFPEVFDPLS